MSDLWHELCARIEDADFDGLAAALDGLDRRERAALLPLLQGHTPPQAVPEPVVLPPLEPEPPLEVPASGVFGIAYFRSAEDGEPPADLDQLLAYVAKQRTRQRESSRSWELSHLRQQALHAARQLTERRQAVLAMAVIACTPAASDVVKALHRPWAAGPAMWALPEMVPGLLRARGADWCATLARGMLGRARSRAAAGRWPFTEALLRAGGAGPPDTPGAVAQYVATWRGQPLAAILAADPWFDAVLPYVFDETQVATAFTTGVAGRDWPPALLELTVAGRVERGVVVAGCLRRLRAGGRQGLLQPFLSLLKELAPGTDELAGHRQELTGLLPAPLSTIADFAYTSLQALHQVHPLDAPTLTEITQSMLSRPEKKLVRAHLRWLRQLPLDDLVEGLVVGLHHPVPELASRTADLIERELPKLTAAARDRVRDEVPALDGAVAQRLATLLGTATPLASPAPLLVADLPALLPPALDLGALAGELAVALGTADSDPVRHELVLDGLVRAAAGDRAAAARVLGPLMPQWPGPWADLVAAVTGLPAPQPPPRYTGPDAPIEVPYVPPKPAPLTAFVLRRLTELPTRLAKDPPPALLATPATVAGHVDPDRVLDLLRRAEGDGWQPLEADLTQALLRLPRDVDAAAHAAAAQLTSPAGQRLAAFLAARAQPRTWVEETSPHSVRSGRRIAVLDPAGLPDLLADPRPLRERASNTWSMPQLALWPMVAPSHREATAAHVQPFVAATVNRSNPGTEVLAGLAAAHGPAGPAMSSTMAYALASHREAIRLAAGDALITLAARPDWDSTGVGAELAVLAGTDRIVLQRTVQPLREALKAGAHDAVWQVASALLPTLLTGVLRPGLADFFTVAGDAARVGRHTADLPELRALAGRPGRGGVVEAARQLAAVLRM